METITRPQHRPQIPDQASRRRRPLGIVVAALTVGLVSAVAVLTVVSLGGGEAPAPATRAEAPVATQAPPAVVPTDWRVVVQGIVAVANDLRINPDPSKLATYMDPTSPQFAEAVNAQSRLADGTWRYDPPPARPTVGDVQVVRADGTSATLTVFFTSTPRYRVLDRSGAVINDTLAGVGVSRWTLSLSGSTWRLVQAVAL